MVRNPLTRYRRRLTNIPTAYLDGDDLEAIRDRDNDGRDLLVDETSEGNNGFQVSLNLRKCVSLRC